MGGSRKDTIFPFPNAESASSLLEIAAAAQSRILRGGLFPFLILVVLVVAFPLVVWAGEIYGSIKEGGKPVGAGVRVEILSRGRPYSTETDQYGSYRLYVKEQGKCQLRVFYQQQSPSIEIASYEESVRYDLTLERRDGQYSLRRQ